ncbi:hypothetical protein D3C74_210540 [compost metagenome]
MVYGDEPMIPVRAPEQSGFYQRARLQIDAALNVVRLGFNRLFVRRCFYSFKIKHFQAVELSFLHSPVPCHISVFRLAEYDTQRIMMLNDPLKHLANRLFVEAFLAVEHHRLIKVMRVSKLLFKIPALDWR